MRGRGEPTIEQTTLKDSCFDGAQVGRRTIVHAPIRRIDLRDLSASVRPVESWSMLHRRPEGWILQGDEASSQPSWICDLLQNAGACHSIIGLLTPWRCWARNIARGISSSI